MFRASTLKLLFGVAFLLPAHADQYPDHAKSTRTEVTVRIVWLPNFRMVDAACALTNGDPPSKGPKIFVGCFDPRTSTIYAVEPSSFNDSFRLEILGHEFWHALGAEHPAN
jgi:hypothetical protein